MRSSRLAAMTLTVVAALAGTGCSSSTGSSAATSTTAPAHLTPFCDAWNRLNVLSQSTAISDVARNIVELRSIAHEFETQAPPDIAPEARRYGAVVAGVAQVLANAGAVSPATSAESLSPADRTKIAAYVKAHCPKG